MEKYTILCLTASAITLCFFGSVLADQIVDRTCSASRTGDGDQIECIHFLKGYQTAKGWRCHVYDWSEYLRRSISPQLWTQMGGLVPILEQTAAAFCDKGIPDK